MERMLRALAASVADMPDAPPLLAGTGKDQTYLLVPVTADRGLAGAFNANIGRATRTLARRLEARGQDGQDPRGRPQGPRLSAARTGQPHHRRHLLRRQAPHRILRRRGDRQPHHRHAGRRRDRRLHPDLQPLPFGDLADRHRAAAHSRAAAAGRRGDRSRRRHLRVRAGRGNHPGAAAAAGAGDPDLSARCWKVPPASTARA